MASVINTNMASLYAQKNLSGAQNALSTSVERLSSGLRINRAKDDAAGLGISEKIKSQVTSLNQGLRNANDAISMVQTAEGSLSEVSSILQRMKELSVQARNDSLSTTQRSFISDELVALKNEINSIAERTTFNDLSLLKNALRTQVAVPAAADATALANGAQLLEGLTIKDLAVKNTNAGTYTFSAAKDTQITNQKSYAVGPQVGTIGLDTTQSAIFSSSGNGSLVLSGVFEVGDTISVPITASTGVDDTALTAGNLVRSFAITNADAIVGNVTSAQLTLGGVTRTVNVTGANGAALATNLQTALRDAFGSEVVDVTYAAGGSGTITVQDLAGRTIGGFSLLNSNNAALGTSGGATLTNITTAYAVKLTGLTDADAIAATTVKLRYAATDRTIDVSSATNLSSLASLIQSDLISAGLTSARAEAVNGDLIIRAASGTVFDDFGAAAGTDWLTKQGTNFVYTVTQENLTLDNDGLSVRINGGSSEALSNIASSIKTKANLLTGTPLGAVTSSGSTVSFGTNPTTYGMSNSAQAAANRTAGERIVTIASDDVAEGNRITLKIGSKEYSVVAGTGAASGVGVADSRTSIALALKDILVKDYGDSVTLGTNAWEVKLRDSAGVDVADISMRVERLTEGPLVLNQASYTSSPDPLAQNIARSVVINDYDVVEGRQFSLKVGTPEFYAEFKVVADHNDDAQSIAEKLRKLAGDRFGTDANEVSTSVSAGSTVNTYSFSLGTSLNFGMSQVVLSVSDMSVQSTVVAKSTISVPNRANVARTITVNQADLAVGNVVSLSINGKEYATQVAAGDLAKDVAYRIASLLQKDYPNTDATTATQEFPVGRRVDIGSDINNDGAISGASETNDSQKNKITLHALANLGLADIRMTVKQKANPGDLTLTANADTGIGGTSQTIKVGQIAAGGAKSYDFDNLGVSFTLENSRSTSVDSSAFAVMTSKVNRLTVEAAMDGEALFQVGAGTRDNVVLDGFKDIRMTGQNKNVGAEKEVFDKVYETLTAISANTTESLSEANFATLENRIEDAITMVSDFRSYFGGQQNRIEFAISNIQAQSENLTAANSRIVDTDYAAETANLTKTQIMQQAATAMLAQANQMPNVILALLK